MFSITGMSFAFSVTAQSNDFSFWSSGFNLTYEERTLEGFLKNPQAQQGNPVSFTSLQCFLKQLKTLVGCLHWNKRSWDLLESTAIFHIGYHSSPVLIQGRADCKHQEAEINTCNHSRSEICYIFSQSSMTASCPCQKRQQGHFRSLHSSTAAGTAQHPKEWLSSRGTVLRDGRKSLPTENHL